MGFLEMQVNPQDLMLIALDVAHWNDTDYFGYGFKKIYRKLNNQFFILPPNIF